jgi:hypothetical protein
MLALQRPEFHHVLVAVARLDCMSSSMYRRAMVVIDTLSTTARFDRRDRVLRLALDPCGACRHRSAEGVAQAKARYVQRSDQRQSRLGTLRLPGSDQLERAVAHSIGHEPRTVTSGRQAARSSRGLSLPRYLHGRPPRMLCIDSIHLWLGQARHDGKEGVRRQLVDNI